jgi:hypothetical protein
MPDSRYTEPELSEKARKLHYWFDNGNRRLAIMLTDMDDHLEAIDDKIGTLPRDKTVASMLAETATKDDLAAMENRLHDTIRETIEATLKAAFPTFHLDDAGKLTLAED